MIVELSAENQQFLRAVVSQGAYRSEDEALDEAVRLLREQEQLRSDVNAGIAQLEQGQGEPLDVECVKSSGRDRLARL